MKWRFVLAGAMLSGALLAQTYPPSAYLKVYMRSQDVQVYIDGQAQEMAEGRDVFETELPEGRHIIRFERPGYISARWDRMFRADSLYVVRLDTLVPPWTAERLITSADQVLKRETTTFVVVSNPTGFEVQANGQPLEKTPVRVTQFPAGRTRITVADASEEFDLEPGGFKRIRYDPQEKKLFDATIDITTSSSLPLEVVDAKLYASHDPELNIDWQALESAHSVNSFIQSASPMYLLDVLFFNNPTEKPVVFRRTVRLYRNGELVEEKSFHTRVDALAQRQSWYSYARRVWPAGFYRIEILDDNNVVLADIAFYVHKAG